MQAGAGPSVQALPSAGGAAGERELGVHNRCENVEIVERVEGLAAWLRRRAARGAACSVRRLQVTAEPEMPDEEVEDDEPAAAVMALLGAAAAACTGLTELRLNLGGVGSLRLGPAEVTALSRLECFEISLGVGPDEEGLEVACPLSGMTALRELRLELLAGFQQGSLFLPTAAPLPATLTSLHLGQLPDIPPQVRSSAGLTDCPAPCCLFAQPPVCSLNVPPCCLSKNSC